MWNCSVHRVSNATRSSGWVDGKGGEVRDPWVIRLLLLTYRSRGGRGEKSDGREMDGMHETEHYEWFGIASLSLRKEFLWKKL